jgi:hypothetical protein
MPVRQHRLNTPAGERNVNNADGKKFYRTVNDIETNTALLVHQRATRHASDLSSPMPRWWLVLPCLLLIVLASAPDTLLMNDFIVRRYERRYGLDSSEKAHRTACRQSSTATPGYWYLQDYAPNGANYNMVQEDAAKLNIKISLTGIIPSLFAIVLLGSNCDTIDRRPLLLLPFFGKVARYSLMLIIISRDLSDTWLVAGRACEALFGSFSIVALSAFAYITDCTHESRRTRPFLFTEVAMLVARVVPVVTVGLWLERFLYIIPTNVCLAFCTIGILYVLFIQPESVQSV